MLIDFEVGNFLSFKDPVRLSMLAATPYKEYLEANTIEAGGLRDAAGNVLGKGSDAHAAAVVGDTVGDPWKDTAGPSLHVLIKLLATITLVLAPLFIG